MLTLSQILIGLISTTISIPVIALILWAVTKLFKLSNSKFLTALKTAAVSAIILFIVQQILSIVSEPFASTENLGMILGIGGLTFLITTITYILVNSYAVKIFYKEKTRTAFLVGTVWTIINFIIGLILSVIFIGIAAAIILATGGVA